jgi:DNA repair and recombination protein RAD54B
LPPKSGWTVFNARCHYVLTAFRPTAEYVVFVTPTQLQLQIFSRILRADKLDTIIDGSSTAESLALIGLLTKISNSPILLKAVADKAKQSGNSAKDKSVEDAVRLLPTHAKPEDVVLSGKSYSMPLRVFI